MSKSLRLGLFDTSEFGALLDPGQRPRRNRTRPLSKGGQPAGVKPRAPSSHAGVTSGSERAAKLLRIVGRAPEVVVKITGTNAEATPLHAHLRYLTTHAKDPVMEDQDGHRLEPTLEGRRELMEQWSLAVAEGRRQETERARELAELERAADLAGEDFVPPPPGPRRTIALHIVLSMPQGTPMAPLMQAARGWGEEELHNHQYVWVLHQDKKHLHVHFVVNNIGHDLRPLRRNREDLQRWRDVFAKELRAVGIVAESSPRKARGIVRKPENRRFAFVKARARAQGDFSRVRVFRAKIAQAENEARGVVKHETHPAEYRARQNREMLEVGMRDAIVRLREQGEAGSQAAALVADFLAKLPPPETEMDELRRALEASRQRPPPERAPPSIERE